MKLTKYLRVVLSLFVLIFIFNIISCTKDCEIDLPLTLDEEHSDFEIIEDETDGVLVGGVFPEIKPNLDRMSGNSARATIVNRCIDVWNKMDTTKYVHSKHMVIDDENGIYKYDCSGFVGKIVVEKVLKNHYSNLKKNTNPIVGVDKYDSNEGVVYKYENVIRPLAGTMYDYFKTLLGDKTSAKNQFWKVFMSVDSLKKGDFIVVRYSDDWRIFNKNKTTGHIMIAWEIGNVNSNNDVTIQVMDATSSAHTKTADTRTMNKKPFAELLNGKKSGIGFGKMKYKISTNGHRRPYAYKWSINSKYYYNLLNGDNISEPDSDKYDRLKGILFVRAHRN